MDDSKTFSTEAFMNIISLLIICLIVFLGTRAINYLFPDVPSEKGKTKT